MKLIALVPLVLANALAAQTYAVKHIVFKNPGGFTQAQLEAAAQVHPGASVTADSLGAAAQRLADTGYFEDVGAALGGTATDIVATFNLKPASRAGMVHVGFENFIWLTPAEVDAAIRAKFPLFTGYLPDGSPAIDLITAALTQALATKVVTAQITHETVEPTLIHPERTLEFRIANPIIRVANVKLAGVTQELVPLLQKSVNATARTTYDQGLSGNLTTDLVLAPLLDAGYIDASLNNLTLDFTPASAGSVPVVIFATLQPKDIYHVSHLAFAGAPLLTADAFKSTQKLNDGDIASRKALLESLKPLDSAYRRQGYMDVIVDSSPKLDRTAHTVAYTVSVTPGERYHVQSVKAEGLDPTAQSEFNTGFLLQPGALYNPEYVESFMKNNTALRSFAGYHGTWKAYANPNNHTVDLVLTFYKGDPSTVITVH